MSRHTREAKRKALLGDRYPMVLVTELGGRKRDRRKLLEDQLMPTSGGEPAGSYQEGTLASLIEKALTNPDTGPETPDLRQVQAASLFPLTAGGLVAAKLQGLDAHETPEGAYVVERPENSDANYGATYGETMFINPEPPAHYPGSADEFQDDVYGHELGHVSQGRDRGILFPIQNAIQQGSALLEGVDPQDAPFEASATREGRAIQRQKLDPEMMRTMTQARRR